MWPGVEWPAHCVMGLLWWWQNESDEDPGSVGKSYRSVCVCVCVSEDYTMSLDVNRYFRKLKNRKSSSLPFFVQAWFWLQSCIYDRYAGVRTQIYVLGGQPLTRYGRLSQEIKHVWMEEGCTSLMWTPGGWPISQQDRKEPLKKRFSRLRSCPLPKLDTLLWESLTPLVLGLLPPRTQ